MKDDETRLIKLKRHDHYEDHRALYLSLFLFFVYRDHVYSGTKTKFSGLILITFADEIIIFLRSMWLNINYLLTPL